MARCEYSCAYLLPQRTRGCGCIGRPAFPTPSVFRAEIDCKPRAYRAARMRTLVWNCFGYLEFQSGVRVRSRFLTLPWTEAVTLTEQGFRRHNAQPARLDRHWDKWQANLPRRSEALMRDAQTLRTQY